MFKILSICLALSLPMPPTQAETLQEKKDTALKLLAPLGERVKTMESAADSISGKFPKAGKHMRKAAQELAIAIVELRKEVNALKEDK